MSPVRFISGRIRTATRKAREKEGERVLGWGRDEGTGLGNPPEDVGVGASAGSP